MTNALSAAQVCGRPVPADLRSELRDSTALRDDAPALQARMAADGYVFVRAVVAPALEGKDIANPMAMLLACGAVLHHAADREGGRGDLQQASRAVYESVLEAVAAGVRTPDLGGHAGMTEFTDDVVARVRTKIEVWSTLGTGV